MNESKQKPLRLAGVVGESVVDGPGFRMTVFVQGCPHRCPGCHNPETHDPDGGYPADEDALFEKFSGNPLLAGITFSGGEPFLYAGPLSSLAQKVRGAGGNVWTYTGYTFEYLFAQSESRPDFRALLGSTDVLVDGPFILAQRSLMCKFRGSKNQRILDARKSLETGRAEEYRFSGG